MIAARIYNLAGVLLREKSSHAGLIVSLTGIAVATGLATPFDSPSGLAQGRLPAPLCEDEHFGPTGELRCLPAGSSNQPFTQELDVFSGTPFDSQSPTRHHAHTLSQSP